MSITPPVERLNAILTRHDIVMAALNAGPDPEAFVAAAVAGVHAVTLLDRGRLD